MKKINKLILIGVLIILSGFFNIKKLNATTASLRAISSKSSVIVGSEFNTTVTISSSSPLGAWEYILNYDSSRLKLVSGNTHILDYGNGSKKSASYNYKFKAISSGKASISFYGYNGLDFNEQPLSITPSNSNVKIITSEELQASYSNNNYLSSLSIEGYELSPTFNKDTLEYSVTLPETVEEINLIASKEDNKASISNIGIIKVEEGNNKIEVLVTAENNNKRTYIINALVKEINPIVVKVENKNYTVVKKKNSLIKPESYRETIIKINNEDIPAFKSDITKYTLVGLKDKNGNIQLYIYNVKNDEYKIYNEYKFNSSTLSIMNFPENLIPDNYKEYFIKINDKKVKVFKKNESDNYSLFYAINILNGKKNIYSYEETEKIAQVYDDTDIKELKNYYNKILIAFGGILLLILICNLISISSNKEKKKKTNNKTEKKINDKKERKSKKVNKNKKKDVDDLLNENL